MPEPKGSQAPVAGFHETMWLARASPAIVNRPPMTTRSACGPGPSGSQEVLAMTLPSRVPGTAAAVPGTPGPASHCVPHCAATSTVGAIEIRNRAARADTQCFGVFMEVAEYGLAT